MTVDSMGARAGPTSDHSTSADKPAIDATQCTKCDEQRSSDKTRRSSSNQRWMKLRTTVQLTGAISSTIQKSKPQLKREDSFLKRFSTRQIPEMQETLDTGDDGDGSSSQGEPETLRELRRRKRRHRKKRPSTVVHPDENFYFYWLFSVTVGVLYNLWTLIVRQSFPEFQRLAESFWVACDNLTDVVFLLDIAVQFRTGYLEQGLVVYDSKKLALHYVKSRPFVLDLVALLPLQLLQRTVGTCPILRFPRFLKIYRVYNYYYMVESRTVYPNFWRVANLVHILLILAHWFGCFYYLLSEAERFEGDWVFPNNSAGYDTLTRKYLGSLYWSTLTLTTIGDLPTPETDADRGNNTNGTTSTKRRRYKKSRMLQFRSDTGFLFTIVSYLIGVFIFATIVGQVGNVITNRNANRLEFERLLDGAKTYMRHHKVPNGMKRRVLRWYDYSWSRGRIQGGGDINTALGLLPDKLKTELALHVNLSVLKKVTIFQECQPEFLHDLVLKMKAFIFTPGDLICRKGEVAREMFIIADGILEVISDTGHVLTTMMAGDFFGEIGILNLDGLNKRTADVRSVGYSELFSLSREDVLAAMKDYPEAQEILQSLGRKRLMEARSITKAIAEHKNRAKLNAAAAHNTAQASDHRTRTKIVERLYSDVKGLKSVLRKSRHSTKSEDSLELEPLTSVCSRTEGQFSGGNKGTLCRMQKVTSHELWPDEDPSTQDSRERRISAGFPLLSKLKTLTDKHQQQQQLYQATLSHHQATPTTRTGSPPSDMAATKEPVQPEPLGAGLPLLQRLLLLKQKEDAEKKSAAAANLTTASHNIATAAPPSPGAVTASTTIVTDFSKKPKNGKKEVVFAEQVLIRKSPPAVDEKRHGSGKGDASVGRKRELLPRPWSLLRKATVDNGTVAPPLEPTAAVHDSAAGWRSLNPHRTLSRLYGRVGTNRHASGYSGCPCPADGESGTTKVRRMGSIAKRARSRPVDRVRRQISESKSKAARLVFDGSDSRSRNIGDYVAGRCTTIEDVDDDDDDSGGGDGRGLEGNPEAVGVDAPLQHANVSEDASSLKAEGTVTPPRPSCRYRSVDDLCSEYLHPSSGYEPTTPTDSRELGGVLRSCSLDSCAARPDDRRVHLALDLDGVHDPFSPPSPGSRETLERRWLKSILKRVSFGSRRIRDIVSRAAATDGDGSRFEVLGRLMRAPTIEGYVARRTTFEKSFAYDATVESPPSPKSFASTTFFPDDRGRDDSCTTAADHSSHHDLLRSSSNRRRSSDETRTKDMEYQVREKDEIIRTLRWKISELQKHHERCFQGHSSDEDTDCDAGEQLFMRDDSVDTVIMSPLRRSSSSSDISQEREDRLSNMRRPLATHNRHSWEDRSEEERLELRDLPTSIKPHPVWRRNEVRINVGSMDETSASDADEPRGPSDDELLLARHDRDWEVRMLARELDRREHRASLSGRVAPKAGPRGGTQASASSRLRSMRSLEERCVDVSGAPASSQRSASSDDIYKPTGNLRPPVPTPHLLLSPEPVHASTLAVPPSATFAASNGSTNSHPLPPPPPPLPPSPPPSTSS